MIATYERTIKFAMISGRSLHIGTPTYQFVYIPETVKNLLQINQHIAKEIIAEVMKTTNRMKINFSF